MSTRLLNEISLRALKRPQIQKLAKREKIKATSKTDTIIGELLAKYPGGVPPLEREAVIARRSRRVAEVNKIKEEVADQEPHLSLENATVDHGEVYDGPEQSKTRADDASSGDEPSARQANTREEDVVNTEEKIDDTSMPGIQGPSTFVEHSVLAPQLKQDGLTTGQPTSAAAHTHKSPRSSIQHSKQLGGERTFMQATQDRAARSTVQAATLPRPALPASPLSIPPLPAPRAQPEAGPSRMRGPTFEQTPTPAPFCEELSEDDNVPARTSTPLPVRSRTPHRVPTSIPQSTPEPTPSSSPIFSPTRPNMWDTPPETRATSDGVDEELAVVEKKAKLNRQLDPNGPIVGCSAQGFKRVRHGIEKMMGRVIHVEALDKTMRRAEDSMEASPEELEELGHREMKLIAGRMVLEQVLGDLKSKKAGWKWQAPTEWHRERMRKAAAVREKERQRKEKKEGKKREEAQVVESRVNNEWKLKVKRQHGLDMSPPRSPPPIPHLHSPFRFDPTRRSRNAPAPFFPPQAPMQQTAAMPPRGVPRAHQYRPAAQQYAPTQPAAPRQYAPTQPAARQRAPAQPAGPTYHRGQQPRSQMPPPPIPRQPVPEDDVPPSSPPNDRVLPTSFHPSGAVNNSRSHASRQLEAGPSQVHVAEPRQVPPSAHNVQQGTQANAHLGQLLAPLGGHSAALMQYYASQPSVLTGLRGTTAHSAHAHPQPQAGPSASYAPSSAAPSTGYAESRAGPSIDYSIGSKRRRVEEEDLEYEEDAVSYASDEPDHGEDGASHEEDVARYEEDAEGYAEDELSYEENNENDENQNEHQSQAVAARGEQGGYRPRPVPGYNGHREASPESRWGSVGYWAPARNAPYKRSRYE